MTSFDAIPSWVDESWTGEPMAVRLRDRFPQLLELADLDLDSPQLAPYSSAHDDAKVVGWLRTRGGIERIGDVLDLAADDILAWLHIGVGKRDQILAWLGGIALEVDSILGLPDSLGGYQQPLDPDLEVLTRWGLFAGHAATWGQVEHHLEGDLPDDVRDARDRLRARALPTVQPQDEADVVLAAWVDSLDDRTRDILRGRLVRSPSRTLDDIGQQHGVTRERIRQLEKKLIDKIPSLLAQDEWRLVRWEVFAVRQRFGSYAPLTSDEIDYLASGEGFARSLVLWVARYERGDGLVRLADFTLPSVGDLPTLDDSPVLDQSAINEQLLAAGVTQPLLDWTLDSIKGVGRVDGTPVLWPGNIVDKAYAILSVRDRQMTPPELAEAMGGGISVTGLRNRLYEDPRLCRTSRSHVGLVAWGGEAYTSVVGLMCSRLEGGPRVLAELTAELAAEFDAKPNSIVAYSGAPVFYVDAGLISLRRADQSYLPRARPERVPTLYRCDTDELVWSIVVDHDLLRGSGRSVAAEVATFLGVQPGVRSVLKNELRDVPVHWLETSHMGPNIGSLKRQVDAVGAVEGDVVQVRVNRSTHVLSVARRTQAPDSSGTSVLIGWITGLPPHATGDREALAAATHTTSAELVDVLAARGDHEVAALAGDL